MSESVLGYADGLRVAFTWDRKVSAAIAGRGGEHPLSSRICI